MRAAVTARARALVSLRTAGEYALPLTQMWDDELEVDAGSVKFADLSTEQLEAVLTLGAGSGWWGARRART